MPSTHLIKALSQPRSGEILIATSQPKKPKLQRSELSPSVAHKWAREFLLAGMLL